MRACPGSRGFPDWLRDRRLQPWRSLAALEWVTSEWDDHRGDLGVVCAGLYGLPRQGLDLFDCPRSYRLTEWQRSKRPRVRLPGACTGVQLSAVDHLWPPVSARYGCAPLILHRIKSVLCLAVAHGAEIALIINLCCLGGCPARLRSTGHRPRPVVGCWSGSRACGAGLTG